MTVFKLAGAEFVGGGQVGMGPGVSTGRRRTSTSSDRTYQLLKNAVLSGRFRSGETVTQRALGELLDAGDMAVREALKRLISEGAFEALPNRSAQVPVLTRQEVDQLHELRSMLEAKAARLAAENISLHQINALRDLVEEMTRAASSGDLEGYRKAHMAFHFTIYQIADNKPLAMLIESLWLRMAPFTSRAIQWIAKQPLDFEKIANTQHGRLLDAFLQRDPDAAYTAMVADHAQLHDLRGLWDELA